MVASLVYFINGQKGGLDCSSLYMIFKNVVFLQQRILGFFSIFCQKNPLMLKFPKFSIWIFQNLISFFQKWPFWDLANVKTDKVLNLGASKHQTVKMPCELDLVIWARFDPSLWK